MADLQLKRGTTLKHSTFTGKVGEATIDTDKDTLVVHDGSTVGGFPMARESQVLAHTSSTGNVHGVTFAQVNEKPITLAGYGITDADTSAQVTTKINNAVAALVDASPSTLDTLNELAAALGDDPNFATTTATAIGLKADTSYVNTQLALKVDDADIASVNLLRADKVLASKSAAAMSYNGIGKLIKVQYTNATDVDYEVLTYNGSNKLSNVAHYIGSVLKGNTVLNYSSGKLVSAPFTAV